MINGQKLRVVFSAASTTSAIYGIHLVLQVLHVPPSTLASGLLVGVPPAFLGLPKTFPVVRVVLTVVSALVKRHDQIVPVLPLWSFQFTSTFTSYLLSRSPVVLSTGGRSRTHTTRFWRPLSCRWIARSGVLLFSYAKSRLRVSGAAPGSGLFLLSLPRNLRDRPPIGQHAEAQARGLVFMLLE